MQHCPKFQFGVAIKNINEIGGYLKNMTKNREKLSSSDKKEIQSITKS